MFNLKIKNYQIIKDVDLSFSTGLNVITGANTSGKTAIFRAIQSLVLNSSYAKGHITHGANKSEVEYSYGGDTVKWIRKPNTTEYEINGVLNSKCGREDLSTVSNLYGFVIDDGKFINMSTEHDNLFPFYKSSTEVFKLFENIFQIEDTQVILNLIKKDDYNISKELVKKKDYLVKTENDLKIINDFISRNPVQTPDTMYEELYESNQKLEELTRLKKYIENLFSELNAIPDIQPVQYDYSILNEYKDLVELSNYITVSLNEVKSLNDISKQDFNFEILSEYRKLLSLNNELVKLQKELVILDNEISIIESGKVNISLDYLYEYKKLLDLYNELSKLNNYVESLSHISKLEFNFDILSEYSKLSDSYVSLNISINEFKELNLSIPNLELNLKTLKDKLFESGYCPVCKKVVGECNE